MSYNYKHLWLLLCFLSTNSLYPKYQHQVLILPKQSSFQFYDGTSIKLKHQLSLICFVEKWRKKLTQLFNKLFIQILQEVSCNPAELFDQLNNEELVREYHETKNFNEYLKSQKKVIYLTEEEIDPEVLSFIKNILSKYTQKQNIKIYLTDAISNATATYGSDLYGHHLFCHASMFSRENIQKMYQAIQDGRGFFYILQTQNGIRWISMMNLAIFGLIDSASRIEHQSALITFIIQECSVSGKTANEKTMRLCGKLYDFQSMLEGVLQVNNPLEVALFILKAPNKTPAEKKIWKSLVQDLAKIYHDNSLKIFKNIAQKIKQQSATS